MKRLIIATALFAAVALSSGQPATKPTYIAGFHPPGAPHAAIELPETDVLQRLAGKGVIPTDRRAVIELPETDASQRLAGKGALPTSPRG